MLLNKKGQTHKHNDIPFTVGAGIYAIGSDYEGLYGTIIEMRDGEHKDTDNPDIDIYCRFFTPISDEVERKIEKRLSSYYCDPVRFEDIAIDLLIMAPDMLRLAKRCRVYQVSEKGSSYMFRSYEYISSQGLEAPPGNIYRIVYDDDLHTDDLEEIYFLLNCRHPEGYAGRSLSVSDIVELYNGDDHEYYYCDTFGFQQIPFIPAEFERS